MPNDVFPHPEPFLELRVFDVTITPNLYAYCAGYESGEWRTGQLAEHVMEWLPEYSLRYTEWKNLGPNNAVRLIKKAAQKVFKSENFESRGEFGEILLHLLIRQTKKTIPAISKIHFKDSRNDTVKGFDCVHVVSNEEGNLELWLGEVKFYSELNSAINDVCLELKNHTASNYLRDEFDAITNKIDDNWPYAEKLKKLLNINTSLDEVFECACIPVLLTYNSQAISTNSTICDVYKKKFEEEVRKNYIKFMEKLPEIPIQVHLFLLPLKSKTELNAALNDNLKRMQ